MIEMGIKVGLGVDGSASNDSSDMLGELRNCFFLNRLKGSSAITARGSIRLGTQGGADRLGRDDIRVIEPDRAAGLVGARVSTICRAGAVHDYTASLALCGCDHSADFNIVKGRVVVRDGKLPTMDEEEVTREANKAALCLVKG
jgi:cytosine/adenosine deaminase-related metal-dependent hydrolase